MKFLQVVDLSFFAVLPLIGYPIGWLIRHARFVVDRYVTWQQPAHEQLEDIITFGLAFALGVAGMVLLGMVYLSWYLAYI